MNSNLKRSRPQIIALAVFCISSLLGFKSYVAIETASHRSLTLLSNIEVGEKKFSILHREDCIGYLRTVFTEGDDLSTIDLKSEVVFSYNGKRMTLPFSGSISLNALMQAGGSFFESRLGENTLFIGTSGVQPVSIQLSIHEKDQPRTVKFEVDGPIVLKSKGGGEKYSLVMPVVERFENLFLDSPFKAESGLLTVDSIDKCGSEMKALDITQIARMFERFNFLPPMGN